MTTLFRHLRIHQIFGANTGVGKTVLTTALARVSAREHKHVFYLKPVSTGPIQDADDDHVQTYAGLGHTNVKTSCLFRYSDPVSPHLAARRESAGRVEDIPSDELLAMSIKDYIRRCAEAASSYSHLYVETAGGVHSPTLSGTTQVDAYRPLYLPTILIGDSQLGGISSTISSYESLLLRGYNIDAVLLFRDEYYRNWEYLQSYFAEREIDLFALDPPPERLRDKSQDQLATERYYKILATDSSAILALQQRLDAKHEGRIRELESMPRRTLDTIWWPFVQHGLVKGEEDVTVIDSAHGDFFSSFNPSSGESLLRPLFDGSASWWTQTLGHAHPSLTQAAAYASGRYGHVMFPKATHLPALKLAERLLFDGPGKGWASRVYYSDDGSTAMEIALKMGLRAYTLQHNLVRDDRKSMGILGLKGSYHGDTIGAMNACEVGVYTCEWHDAKGFWLDPPTVSVRQGHVCVTVPPSMDPETGREVLGDSVTDGFSMVYNVPDRLNSSLAVVYRQFIASTLDNLLHHELPPLAALVLEPLVMGAGGMIFVDPLFQRVLVDVVREKTSSHSEGWKGVPVIFDEVFVGLHRLGLQSAIPLLGVTPDISVNAKILTGGLVPLAATLATDSIFKVFLSDKKADALLHGHSYTAHAIGCEVANKTLKTIANVVTGESWRDARSRWEPSKAVRSPVFSLWDPKFIEAISDMPAVDEAMSLGTVLSVKLAGGDPGYTSQSAETRLSSLSKSPLGRPGDLGVHFRTLGDVAYFMTSLNTPPATIRTLEERIWRALSKSN